MERDSHMIVQRQIEDDLRNSNAFLFCDVTLDVDYNEEPIVLCEACGDHTFAERDGLLVVGNCDHCGEVFTYTKDDARVVSNE